MEVDEGSDQKSDVWRQLMAVHACLKNEFTEGEKCQNLMGWIICKFSFRGNVAEVVNNGVGGKTLLHSGKTRLYMPIFASARQHRVN